MSLPIIPNAKKRDCEKNMKGRCEMPYKIRPALKSSPKHLIGLYSESGCGKTFPALLLSKGYAGDMSKVCMIETESGRGEMYAEHKTVGGYLVLPMSDNFSPSEY